MNTVSKQDGVYPRTPSALAQQYDFGKVFDEITGIKLTVAEQEAMMEAELSLKLGYDDNDQIVSMLNASANIITIRGNRLTIESDHFELTADGTIHATAGEIGGCVIENGVLKVPTANITGRLTADQIDTGSFTAKLDEIEERLGDAEDSITKTNTSLTVLSGQIESKVSQTDFDALGNTVSTHETRINQTEQDITLKVSQTEFDALSDDVATNTAEIKVTKDQIAALVEWKDGDINTIAALTQKANEHEAKINTLTEWQTDASSSIATIEQKANDNEASIKLKVSQTDFDNLGERVSTAESNITALSGEISAKVSYTEFNALGDELASVQGELSLKIDETNLISTLNATADVISLNYDQLILNGENVSFSDGVMHLLELYVGDGWSNHLEVDSTGMRLSSFYVRDSYDVVTGHSTYLGVDNLYCAYASAGGWTFDTNSATLTTADGYLTFGIGGVFGTATNGHTILWSDLYNLVNS